MSSLTIDLIRDRISPLMTPERLHHSVGCSDICSFLAGSFGLNEKTAAVMGLCHDIARDFSEETTGMIVKKMGLEKEFSQWLNTGSFFVHAPLSAYITRQEYCADLSVFQAIYYHPTATAPMDSLSMILTVADFCEPGRNFPEAELIRKEVEQSSASSEMLPIWTLRVLEYKLAYGASRGTETCKETERALCYLKQISSRSKN